MIYFASTSDITKLDELSVSAGLAVRQMMELAGWNILNVFKELRISERSEILVLVGKGNKGGDGLCAARHLINYGWEVGLVLMNKDIKPDPMHQLNLLRKMNVSFEYYDGMAQNLSAKLDSVDVVIDALIGYNLNGAPEGEFAEVIDVVNRSRKFLLAYDIPSGIEASTGKCHTPCIKANTTLTLGLAKAAFREKEAQLNSGRIYLADIGIPEFVYDQISPGIRPNFKASANYLLRIN